MTVIKKASAGSISIHAPHEGGDGGTGIGNASRVISIHAPREGGDEAARADLVNWKLISIHASREGGDHGGGGVVHAGRISIHAPARGATPR